jgi:SAM-dependent methyltransferase
MENAKMGPCKLIDLRDCNNNDYKRIFEEIRTIQIKAQSRLIRFIFWIFGKYHKLLPIWSRHWEYPWAILNADLHLGQKVLDAGCGNAPLLRYLAKPVLQLELFGIDLDEKNTQKNWKQKLLELFGYRQIEGLPENNRCQNVILLKQSMANINFVDNYFDRILSISVIEHIPADEQLKAMAEMGRVLKPDGRLIITLDLPQRRPELNDEYLKRLVKASGLSLLNEIDCYVSREIRHNHTYEVAGIVLIK